MHFYRSDTYIGNLLEMAMPPKTPAVSQEEGSIAYLKGGLAMSEISKAKPFSVNKSDL
jgi:hypothetical protein